MYPPGALLSDCVKKMVLRREKEKKHLRHLILSFWVICAFIALLPRSAHAQQTPITRTCILRSADAFHIPYRIILTLLRTEGGQLGMEHHNDNGTYDLGPMQVNSRWIPDVASFHFGGDRKAAWSAVRDWGCYNILIGTWVFRTYVDEAGGNLAEAVGLYNSHNIIPKLRYQRRFAANYAKLFFGSSKVNNSQEARSATPGFNNQRQNG